jgi:hypothetical protein
MALLAALVLGAIAGPAAAGPEPKAVVELYTSQGCSSCPPADRVLVDLAREPDIIALSFPVDYWDYLGWKDTLASPAFSARQRAYAQARGDKQVFTPQIIVNGSASCVGSDRGEIQRSVARATGGHHRLSVPITLSESGKTLIVEVGRAEPPRSAEVWVLPVIIAREVAIGRGENSGRSVTYANVVRRMVRAGSWSGAPARFEVPMDVVRADNAESYVVLLQSGEAGKPGPILGAAKGPRL